MKYIFLLLVLLVFISCKSDDDINRPNIEASLSARILSDNTQEGYILQTLDSTIVIEVKNKNQAPYLKAKFKYNILSENGMMCAAGFDNKKGIYKVAWLLGCQEGTQEAEIVVCDSADRKITTFKITANATKDKVWNRSCGLPVIGNCFEFEEPEMIVKHPDSRLFLLANQNRMYTSINEGSSWTKIHSFNSNVFGVFLKLFITNESIILIASEKGLFKSIDGKEWSKISDFNIERLFVIDNNILFIRTSSGNFRTDNLGVSWQRIDNPNLWGLDIKRAYKIDKSRICMLTSDKTVFLSEDNGQTWERMPSTKAFYDIIDLNFHNGHIYLVNLSAEMLPVIYKSGINNISWKELASLTTRPSNSPSKTDLKFFGDKVYALSDSHIFEIDEIGNRMAVTGEILNRISFINTFEVTNQGNLVFGAKWGKGAFYRSIK